MENLLVHIVDYGQTLGAEYVEIRTFHDTVTSLKIKDGKVNKASSGSEEGAAIRVLVDGSWGFSSAIEIKKGNLADAVRKAIKLAKGYASRRKIRVKLADVKSHHDKVMAPVRYPPEAVSIEEKLKELLDASDAVKEYENIASSTIEYEDHTIEKWITTSDGTFIKIKDVKTLITTRVTAARGGILYPAFEVNGGTIGFELLKTKPLTKTVRDTAKRALTLLEAKAAPVGEHEAILDQDLVGVLAHEAVGHTAEADLVLSGSYLKGKIGMKIGSDLITLVDDAGPPTGYGWTPYDDEGVPEQETVIIDKGVVTGYMHNRETAELMNVEPTGNARAWGYAYEPIIRMRNTYIKPGHWSLREMIEETKSGVLLKGNIGGMADTNGEFTVGVQWGNVIRNGEEAEPFRATTIIGNVFDVLKSVSAVGKEFDLKMAGICGKWQPMFVGGGGPPLKCRVIVGGTT